MIRRRSIHHSMMALAMVAGFVTLAPTAMAASAPKTRLVSCGGDSCLLVTGHREDNSSIVSINGHRVNAQGGGTWKTVLQLDTVRSWAGPMARSIDVSVYDPSTGTQASHPAKLPIGLLGHVTDLAALVIGSP